jgi:hypothetical protein
MNENTKQLHLFKAISGKAVHVDFDGGELSSDSGIILLREVLEKLNLVEKVAALLPDDRHPSYIKHTTENLLTQRVLQIIAGYEDGNDCNALRNDPVFKIGCGKASETDDPLASQPTMCRFEHRIDNKTLVRLARLQVEFFTRSYDAPPEGIILDFDDTEDQTYGAQQLSLFNGYYDSVCYQPMHIYEGKSGKVIATILRPGKRPTGKEIAKMIRRVVRLIRKAWPNVGIVVRGDSHYNGPEVLDICRELNLDQTLGLTGNAVLKKAVQPIVKQAEELFALDPKPFKLYHDFEYQAGTWSEPERVIAKIEYTEKLKLNIRFVTTSFKNARRQFVYETCYCGRGQAELYIKEHKRQLGSDRTSSHLFAVNQFRLIFFNLAYMALHYFRDKYLKNTCFAKADFNTIRLRLIKIAGQIKELSTRIKVHLCSSYPYQNEFRTIYNSLTAYG